MASPEKLLLARLNYEWENLVNLIKYHNYKTWQLTYELIEELTVEKLNGVEVSISSEYMIFDNCFQQTGDVSFILIYNKIVEQFKKVFRISSCMSMKDLRRQFKKNTKSLSSLDYHLNIINGILPFIVEEPLHLNLNDMLLIEDYMEFNPEIYSEVKNYIEAIYMFEIEFNIPNLDVDSDSEDDEVPDLTPGNCLLL